MDKVPPPPVGLIAANDANGSGLRIGEALSSATIRECTQELA